jgi:hypothetical protein
MHTNVVNFIIMKLTSQEVCGSFYKPYSEPLPSVALGRTIMACWAKPHCELLREKTGLHQCGCLLTPII